MEHVCASDQKSRRAYRGDQNRYERLLTLATSYNYIRNTTANTLTTVNPTASPTHAYNYDPAGNRTSSLDGGVTTNYTTNSVNAYTSINNNSISHDPNGNMLNDVNTSYTYDKENRLRSISQNGTITGYTYDALSRCNESFNNTAATDNRERYTWSGWTLLNRELFTGTTPTSSFRYTWGLDLSESLEKPRRLVGVLDRSETTRPAGLEMMADHFQQRAGGVGGLFAIERIVGSNTDIRFPHYDANGNIIALTDSTGNVSARYRYDAFGKVLNTTDLHNSNWITHNIHGFSTKPTYGIPNLLYYGYRHYAPTLGRWLNRDPIEESGGLNLYGFVGNKQLISIDILGTFGWPSDIEDCKKKCYGAGASGDPYAYVSCMENCIQGTHTENCGNLITRVTHPDSATSFCGIGYIVDKVSNACGLTHYFAILSDGERLKTWGSATGENHHTAKSHSIKVKPNKCNKFNKCMKDKVAEYLGRNYTDDQYSVTNDNMNCQSIGKMISECGGSVPTMY